MPNRLFQAAANRDRRRFLALRNTIYGLGTRLLLSKKGYDPKFIHAQAWRYFENALSVHSRVLFSSHKDLTGVQALALMVCADVISSRPSFRTVLVGLKYLRAFSPKMF